MKSIKNIIKKSCLLGAIAVIVAANIFPMRMPEAGKKAAKSYIQKMQPQLQAQKEEMLQKEREGQYRPGKYFIYEQGTANGILVDAAMAKQNCKTIKLMVEDLGEEPNEIHLPSPFDTIKLGFGLLDKTVEIRFLSFAELVDVANLFNFLDVPVDTFKTILVKIKETIDKSDVKNINEELKKLHPDLQKVLFANTSDDLKDCIIKKYAKGRGKPLVGHPDSVFAVAFSPDGTKIVSGCYEAEHVFMKNNVILWDVTNPNNIIKYPFVGGWNIGAVAFSPDSKHVTANTILFGAMLLWNITDLNELARRHTTTAVRKTFGQGQGQDLFDLVAFSPDGKSVFSCGNKFTVWDISNPDNITGRQLLTDLSEGSVFSPDGTLVASGGDNIFMIKDVSGSEVIEYKPVGEINIGKIHKLAFSPDGKTVISYGHGLFLWDVSNLKNITNRMLFDILDFVKFVEVNIPQHVVTSLIFSHDGKKIALGHFDGFILLDIDNPNNQVVIDNIGMKVHSMALSPDGKQIVTGGESVGMLGKNLILWTLLTDQEEALLNQIKNYNADQVRLIYQLCLQSSKGQSIALKKGSEEYEIFMTLPEDMQKLLTDLFIPKGWLSGWWQ